MNNPNVYTQNQMGESSSANVYVQLLPSPPRARLLLILHREDGLMEREALLIK